jgi:hypothetical protein
MFLTSTAPIYKTPWMKLTIFIGHMTTNDAINILEDLVGVVKGEINGVDVRIGYVDES